MSNILSIDLKDFDEDDLLAGNIIYNETGKTQVISINVQENERGPRGYGVPAGGSNGQIIVKQSDQDYDMAWTNLNVPTKTSDLTNDSGFITASNIPVTSVNGQTGDVTVNVPTRTSQLTNDSTYQTADNVLGSIQIHNASANAHGDIRGKVTTIEGLIPNQASTSNQLADKNFVNSSVQTATANFRGNWTDWASVPTTAASYPADYAGNKTPTVNDYLVVQDASDYTEETLAGTWRFKYTGNWDVDGKSGWEPEYQVNETPLTAAQLAALNSGITSALVAKIPTVANIVVTLTANPDYTFTWSGADSIADIKDAHEAGASIAIVVPGVTDESYSVIEAWWETEYTELGLQSVDNDAALLQLILKDDNSATYSIINLQQKLSAGTGINISGNTISSTVPTVTVDSALFSSSTNPVQNQALYPAIVPTEIRKIAYTYDWSEPSGTNTYNCIAILTLPSGSFTDNSLVELVFDNDFNEFAKHGFCLYSSEVSSQRLWITSIGKPTATINFKFRIWKYGS